MSSKLAEEFNKNMRELGLEFIVGVNAACQDVRRKCLIVLSRSVRVRGLLIDEVKAIESAVSVDQDHERFYLSDDTREQLSKLIEDMKKFRVWWYHHHHDQYEREIKLASTYGRDGEGTVGDVHRLICLLSNFIEEMRETGSYLARRLPRKSARRSTSWRLARSPKPLRSQRPATGMTES